MNNVYILEADPTRMGGIQQFVRNLSTWLPSEKVTLLSYYGDLAQEKEVRRKLYLLNDRQSRSFWGLLFGSKKGAYFSKSSIMRNWALLRDLWQIRCNMTKQLASGGNTLIVNSASALLLFCSPKVLSSNRIILVQHNAPHAMYRRSFDFGGVFRKQKIAIFKKYVESFVMLSPYEQDYFCKWLPLEGKKCTTIRHAIPFPKQLPQTFPRSVAILARLVTQKRIDRAIICAKQLPDVQFNIYGSGLEETRLRKLADGIANVHFRGYTNDTDAVFEHNSLLLITSDYEGYPIAGIEACVHCRPIIAINTFPSAKDLIADGQNGRLISDFSDTTLAQVIQDVMAIPKHYQEGSLQHRSLFESEKIKQQWLDLLFSKSSNHA